MGYTHTIYFDKFVKSFGFVVHDQHFQTTSDMVNRHVKGLEANKDVSNIRVVENKK